MTHDTPGVCHGLNFDATTLNLFIPAISLFFSEMKCIQMKHVSREEGTDKKDRIK